MPAKETAKASKEPTPTDEPVSPVPAMALGSSGSDMETMKQMLLQIQQQMQQMQQQMQQQNQNLNMRMDRMESKSALHSEPQSPTPARTESHGSSTYRPPTNAQVREDLERQAQQADEQAARSEKNKPSPTPVLKPMAHKQYYANVMDAETIQDYQQYLQGVQVSFIPFNSVIGYRPSDLATAGRGVSTSYAANLLFLTNLDPNLQVHFLAGRDLHTMASSHSFDALSQAIDKWLIDRIFQNDFGRWCRANKQAESQDVATHNNRLRLAVPHFPQELACNLGKIQLFESYADHIQEELLDGKVDKSKLPEVDDLFRLALQAEKTLLQVHHSQTARYLKNEQHVARRDDTRVMSLFTSPHGPTCDFDLPPKPPPRRPLPNSSTAPVNMPPPSRAPPPPTAGSTSDGFRVFLAAHANEVPDPSSWTPPDPLHAFNETGLPRSLSYLAAYTNTADSPRALIQVAGDIPSVLLGVNDPEFQDLAEPVQAHHAVGRALPQYEHQVHYPPPLVMALTQELNHGRLEPPTNHSFRIQEAAELLQKTVQAFCSLCPSLAPQFRQIGQNREKALRYTQDNKCWKCGEPGHIAAHCTTPKRDVFATDRRKA